jgi:hypothetical protein
MSPSPHDPEAIPRTTVRRRLAWNIGRRLEPLAVRLLDWCRALEARVGDVERRVEEGQRRASDDLTEIQAIEGRVGSLEGRADEAWWGREALVERINELASRHEGLMSSMLALEEKAEQAYWAREAAVERLGQAVADQAAANLRIESLERRIEEHVPLPMAFGLDALAMGRRLAAIEDHVEQLLVQGDPTGDDRAAPRLVRFSPRDPDDLATEGDKAAV